MTPTHLFLCLAIGAVMGAVAGWRKAQCGRPRPWLVDVSFAALGALVGGAIAVAVDATLSSGWIGLVAAALGAAALLLVSSLRWHRSGNR